jgi:hypothetical protein
MALPDDKAHLFDGGLDVEIFEYSCTLILQNESEDIPLDTFLRGKANALAHYIKLMPYRLEITGALANPPSHWGASVLYGGYERPIDLVEKLRQMAGKRTTYTYLTPTYRGMVFRDLIIEDVAITGNNQAHNIYEVRLQLKNVMFYDSLQEFFGTLETFAQNVADNFGLLAPTLIAGGAIGGALLGAIVFPGLGPIAGAAIGTFVGGAAAGALAIAGGVLQYFGMIPTVRGSLPWQKFTTPIGPRGEYEFEIFPHRKGYPVISVRKGSHSIVEGAPIRMGEDVLGAVQHDEYARGLHLIPLPTTEGVFDVTNDNFGRETQLFIFTFDKVSGG